MKFAILGKSTLKAEVTNISPHGIWMVILGEEKFLSFIDFPWFRSASVENIYEVELPGENHLYWPKLDIDLAVDSIDHPQRYPLVSQAGHSR